jgi:hypothetical protein
MRSWEFFPNVSVLPEGRQVGPRYPRGDQSQDLSTVACVVFDIKRETAARGLTERADGYIRHHVASNQSRLSVESDLMSGAKLDPLSIG